ncbi:NfeD family protein [Lysobacter koreensis]|uniref:NfeD family protein n=1 Tax=Lysobacter koreensis TaxID=266122 RepID=A0ABW2YMN5_9GAMM
MNWNWESMTWAAVALLLFAAETLAPGAFMLWLGLAASVVFVAVLLVPGLSVLTQVAAFVVLSFISIQVYRTWFRGRERKSDQPSLNRRADQLVGRVVPLEQAIVNGQGRVQIADAYWDVRGPDLPAGTAVRIVATDGMALQVELAG